MDNEKLMEALNAYLTRKRRLANIYATICGVWFCLAGWIWVEWLNVYFVFPFAAGGFYWWNLGKKSEKKTLNKIAGFLLFTGLALSILSLPFAFG